MKRDDFEMRFQPARTEQGRSLPDNRGEPPGNSWWGVCRPVFQIRPKNFIFNTRFQTWTLKFIPFCTPGKGRNYAVIPKIRTSSLKKISWNPFLIRILLAFLLIHLELNRQIRTFIHSRSSLKNHTRFHTKMHGQSVYPFSDRYGVKATIFGYMSYVIQWSTQIQHSIFLWLIFGSYVNQNLL